MCRLGEQEQCGVAGVQGGKREGLHMESKIHEGLHCEIYDGT